MNTLDNYPFAVYATQGGGYCRFVNCTPIFIEAPPNQTALVVGNEVPQEWDLAPANFEAREIDAWDCEQTQGSFNRTC